MRKMYFEVVSKGIGVIRGVLKCTQAIYLGQLIEWSPHFRVS